MKQGLLLASLGALLATGSAMAKDTTLSEKVRHELAMLPYYTVFDNINYEVTGNTVILTGAVHIPALALDAVGTVKHIPGVETVENQIEVLPPSRFDDQIRVAAWRAVTSWPSMSYLRAIPLPPVRILVKDSRITLVGVVPTQADKDALTIRLNSIPYVFNVTNDLQVENPAPHKS
jgi:hyperosmotically inducible protein